MTSFPEDPVTPAGAALAVLHEVFTGLCRAGFTLQEAALIIAAVIVLNGNIQQGQG